MAPEDVERFTPGGIGATLSPISAIFLTTTPAKGARISVFCSWASREGVVGLRLRELRLGDPDTAGRRVTLVDSDDLLRRQVVSQPGLPLVLGEVGLGALHGGARPKDRRLVVEGLEPRDHLALAHHAALFDLQVREAALDLGGDDGLSARDHVARCRQDRRARARLRRRGRPRRRSSRPRSRSRPAARAARTGRSARAPRAAGAAAASARGWRSCACDRSSGKPARP